MFSGIHCDETNAMRRTDTIDLRIQHTTSGTIQDRTVLAQKESLPISNESKENPFYRCGAEVRGGTKCFITDNKKEAEESQAALDAAGPRLRKLKEKMNV